MLERFFLFSCRQHGDNLCLQVEPRSPPEIRMQMQDALLGEECIIAKGCSPLGFIVPNKAGIYAGEICIKHLIVAGEPSLPCQVA
jgi:hypothetical protein